MHYTSSNTLRDICICLKAYKNKLYHPGIMKYVKPVYIIPCK
ncbi:DUF4372 domain-containing protein [Mucilaginibacter xinganensis]